MPIRPKGRGKLDKFSDINAFYVYVDGPFLVTALAQKIAKYSNEGTLFLLSNPHICFELGSEFEGLKLIKKIEIKKKANKYSDVLYVYKK